jgi:predicted DNA-binding transcriptional regulator AlpA
VLAVCAISSSTLRRWVAAGLFPPPRCANRRGMRLWLEHEIQAWQRLRACGWSDERLHALVADMLRARVPPHADATMDKAILALNWDSVHLKTFAAWRSHLAGEQVPVLSNGVWQLLGRKRG